MRQSTLLRQFFLPPSSIKIGRFVCNVDSPHQDYYDPTPPLEPSSIIENLQAHYTGSEALDNHRTFASDLTSFLSASISTRTETSIRVTTKQVKTYYLDNSGQWFRDKVQLEDVRKWIERVIDEGESIYLVIGYHTVLDAQIETQNSEGKDIGSQLAAPLSTALAASGVIIPLTDLLNPSVAGSTGHTEERKMKFKAQGEQIVAVQYRKVRFRFLSSKSVDKATLEKQARWMRFDRPRYLRSEGDDMVEIELDDRLELQGEREEYNVGSDEIIFSSLDEDIE